MARILITFAVAIGAIVFFGQKLLEENDGCVRAANGACVDGNTSVGYGS